MSHSRFTNVQTISMKDFPSVVMLDNLNRCRCDSDSGLPMPILASHVLWYNSNAIQYMFVSFAAPGTQLHQTWLAGIKKITLAVAATTMIVCFRCSVHFLCTLNARGGQLVGAILHCGQGASLRPFLRICADELIGQWTNSALQCDNFETLHRTHAQSDR